MSKADNKELEEAINFLEKMLKEYKVFGDLHNPEFEDTEKIYKQIETVLTELKRLQEETIEKNKIREKIEERKFKLQQEYRNFEDDIKLNILA